MGIAGIATQVSAIGAGLERALGALSGSTYGNVRHSRETQWKAEGVAFGRCGDSELHTAAYGSSALFDGRIDNVADIRRSLSCAPGDAPSAAALCLAAYEHWGETFADRVVGDFAVAIWDGRARRLVLSCDPGGLRPLFYRTGRDEIRFASEARGILADPSVPKELDEDTMARWLARLPLLPGRSFYRDVFRVSPGHAVVWRDARHRIDRYWRPEDLPELRYRCDEDYVEAAREKFLEAVRCRLGSDAVLGCSMSGGLDSTSIAATAAPMLAKTDRRLIAYTLVPSHEPVSATSDFIGDERSAAAAVAAGHANMDHVLLANDSAPMMDSVTRRQAADDWPLLQSHGVAGSDTMFATAQKAGIRIMLVGWKGEISLSRGEPFILSIMLRTGQWTTAAREAFHLYRRGYKARRVAWEAFGNLLSPQLRDIMLRAAGRPAERSLWDISAVNREMLREVSLFETAERQRGHPRYDPRLRTARAGRLITLERHERLGLWAAGTRRLFGIDIRDPMGDRRLIDLCLAIPEGQFLRKGVTRALIRRVMAGRLPPIVLDEQRLGVIAADWPTIMTKARPDIADEIARLEQSALAQRFLDVKRLRRAVDNWPRDGWESKSAHYTYALMLSRALTAGRFIRSLEGGNA